MHRSFSSAILAAVLLISTASAASPAHDKFSKPLPIPSTLQPKASTTVNGQPMEYYEITVDAVTKKGVFSSKPDAITNYLGYNGQVPGPTIKVKRGVESVVRMINNDADAKVLHLHGSFSRAPFDGWADDLVKKGQYKDYYYPNKQNGRTLFYHDHTNDHTEANVRKGLGGFYIIEDDAEDAKLNFPKDKYDVPIMLSATLFTEAGDIDPKPAATHHGDTILANGAPWPYLDVEPRKYRFRLLNGATQRAFNISIADDANKKLSMKVIAGDAGYANKIVPTDELVMGMAERYEIIVDFADFKGKTLTVLNGALKTGGFNEPEYPIGGTPITNNIMQFRVGQTVSDNTNNGEPSLDNAEKFAVIPQKTTPDDVIDLAITGGKFTLKGRFFNDGKNRVLRNVPRGTTEQWRFRTIGAGFNHPLHVHLVEFQVVGRTGGRGQVAEYEKHVQKDVVTVTGNEVVDVIAVYAPWSGVYMFHCHNLAHEDAGMMMAFDVTKLKDFGYPESTTRLENPMQPEYLAKDGGSISASEATSKVLPFYAGLGAYPNPDEVTAALKEYHATHIPTPTGSPADPEATAPIEDRSIERRNYAVKHF